MRQTLMLQCAGADPERRDLSSPATAGGSRADDLQLPGAPPCALRLLPCAAGLVVEACVSGARAAGRPLPAGARRLLRSGESVELGGHRIALPAAVAAEGTRVAAAALLRDASAIPEAPIGGVHLVVVTGPEAGARHPLGAEQVLGRGRAADIRVRDAQASRRHARLRLDAEGAFIEDLGSKNGLRVNGMRLERLPCALRDGDELTVGDTTLVFVHPGARTCAALPASADAPGRRAPRLPLAHLTAAALLGLSAAALALASSS
ncbi:FHA domain-containing protein [Anaeromyxobacter sp. SG66]|uniref:FHA domain-containing protein n=1 Tax=Anaeromyxobacter sp. SG66 TaxID=2925410 RepID=UPI001F5672F1|nr:FHA domain-containing protein [Anaeromyxobacter sp. SG66]